MINKELKNKHFKIEPISTMAARQTNLNKERYNLTNSNKNKTINRNNNNSFSNNRSNSNSRITKSKDDTLRKTIPIRSQYELDKL